MSDDAIVIDNIENAWNPGLLSDIPQQLWPLVTLFREEHAYVSYEEAKELADLTGLDVHDLVSLRPERLVTHALLVKVTADLTVPDGPSYEELGINLRAMVESIYTEHVKPLMPAITRALDEERERALRFVSTRLAEGFDAKAVLQREPVKEPTLLQRWFGKPAESAASSPSEPCELMLIEQWRQELATNTNEQERACLDSLAKCVDTIMSHRGRMLPDHSLVARIVVNQVMNTNSGPLVDQMIDTVWHEAIEALGFRLLPVQSKPVIMNVKGASASGKSTIRPQQRRLAKKLGIPWEDFALISPDYWRKYLLDYASLGEHYKYGAMLTGRELEIVDKKLDAYMAEKASNKTMSHLLIDRFRFDSFTLDIDKTADSKLLSRFGDQVYLFFMVTHPAETVTRAWSRGQTTGRFKAVDDLLYHNVEAFTGMPALFLSWVNSKDKQIHFEFLDNDVPEGDLPKTAAFGRNNLLIVLDVTLLLSIDRNRKVNISARDPDDIFQSADKEPASNTGFVEHCAKTLDCIVLADQETMIEYAVVQKGALVWWDYDYIQKHADNEDLAVTLSVLGYRAEPCGQSMEEFSVKLDPDVEKLLMVGHWSAR